MAGLGVREAKGMMGRRDSANANATRKRAKGDTGAGVRSCSWTNLLLTDGWREARKRGLGAEGVRRRSSGGRRIGRRETVCCVEEAELE